MSLEQKMDGETDTLPTDSNSCPYCDTGKLYFNARKQQYICSCCSKNYEFFDRIPKWFKVRRNSSMPLVSSDGDWARLRSLDQRIIADDEWKKYNRKIGNLKRTYGNKIQKMWSERVTKKASVKEKCEVVIGIAEDLNLPIRLASAVLYEQKLWTSAGWALSSYNLWLTRGKEIEKLWARYNKNKSLDLIKILEKISTDTGVDKYYVSRALSFSGIYRGGNWDIWSNEKYQTYGTMICKLWDGQKDKNKTAWALCQFAEQISKCTGRDVSPRLIMGCLENINKREDAKLNYYLYYYYLTGKEILETLKKCGTKTVKELEQIIGRKNRTICHATDLLEEAKLVETYIDSTPKLIHTKYVYLPNSRDIFDKIPDFRIINEVLHNSEITSQGICKLFGYCGLANPRKKLQKLESNGYLKKSEKDLYYPTSKAIKFYEKYFRSLES